jgi:hypothetical protein
VGFQFYEESAFITEHAIWIFLNTKNHHQIRNVPAKPDGMHDLHPVKKKNKNLLEEATSKIQKKNAFSGNGDACRHLDLDKLLIKTEGGCILRCANCKRIIIRQCPCVTDETLADRDIQGLMPCLYWRSQVFF